MSNPTFDFDVFVSYSSKDRRWVFEELLTRLEPEFRVCIDRRNFEAGVPISTNIERAVERSRHTLVILSPHFTASPWCAYEAQLIKHHDPIGQRRRLIPLMLADCKPPAIIAVLTYRDFTDPSLWHEEWPLLIDDLRFGLEDALGEPRPQEQANAAVLKVQHGLSAAALLVTQAPNVPNEARAGREILQKMVRLISVLTRTLDIRDQLDRIKFVFQMVADQKKRVAILERYPTDERSNSMEEWDRLRRFIVSLRSATDSLINLVERDEHCIERVAIEQLKLGLQQLDEGCAQHSIGTLAEGTEELQYFVGTVPSTIDRTLEQTVKSMPFYDLVAFLSHTCSALSEETCDKRQMRLFQEGTEQLFNLKQRINSALRARYLLLKIVFFTDDCFLESAESTLKRLTRKAWIEELLMLPHSEVLAKLLGPDGAVLAALSDADPHGIRRCFVRLNLSAESAAQQTLSNLIAVLRELENVLNGLLELLAAIEH